ncbi:DUF5994 family protein [Blastococcus brunescens]|uniref:DUF5994 family protein n=1 Tax=Blastococcus brunescens TaxID=1564165 RepID=A0ABZ1B6Q3_9ACTN|nr:DUF5994 family protein [Blastococcus sp. BMG 8361]WRL65074.1 DUF5994 family protein [Blastococcus sp. BMG 8361]
MSLRDNAGDGASAFDGAWFPRGRDLAVELPELIAELDRRGLRVERFTYALDAWSPVARKVEVQGRIVRTGGFRSMDAGVVCLTWAGAPVAQTCWSCRRRPTSSPAPVRSGSARAAACRARRRWCWPPHVPPRFLRSRSTAARCEAPHPRNDQVT